MKNPIQPTAPRKNNIINNIRLMQYSHKEKSKSLRFCYYYFCHYTILIKYISNSRTTELDCLDDQPPGTAEKSYDQKTKPGTIYTANQQCRLMLGPTAELCVNIHADGQV